MAHIMKDLDEIEKIVDDRIEKKTRNLTTKDEFFTKIDEVNGRIENY